MVDPVSQRERDSFNRKLQAGIAALVAASTGMVALGAGASLLQAAAAGLGGVVVGALIAWWVVPSGPAPADRQRSFGREDPFADGGDEDETEETARTRSTTRRRE